MNSPAGYCYRERRKNKTLLYEQLPPPYSPQALSSHSISSQCTGLEAGQWENIRDTESFSFPVLSSPQLTETNPPWRVGGYLLPMPNPGDLVSSAGIRVLYWQLSFTPVVPIGSKRQGQIRVAWSKSAQYGGSNCWIEPEL